MNHQPQEHNSVPNFWSTRYAIGLLVLGGVAAYFLLTEHLAHVIGFFTLFTPFSLSTHAYFYAWWSWTSPSTEKIRPIR